MRRAEPLAGLGGLLLLVSLFLPWYRDGVYVLTTFSGGTEAVHALRTWELTGWRAFTVIDVLLALLAALALAVPLSSLLATGPAKPVAVAVLASAFGWLAVLLVGFRLLFPDDPSGVIELRFGIWLALAGALIAWVGSWLSLRDESTPGAVAPDIPRQPAPAVS